MSGKTEAGGAGWLDDEVVPAGLPDKRLARRLRRLLDQMSAAPGQPVPAAGHPQEPGVFGERCGCVWLGCEDRPRRA